MVPAAQARVGAAHHIGQYQTSGPAEAGQSYLDGHQKSRRADKRGKRRKTAVVGIKDRKTGTVRAMPVPETTAARLTEFVESNTTKDARVFTDECRVYNGLDNHETANHSDGEYVRGKVRINGMESFWALVRRGYNGTLHCIEPNT